MLPIVIIHNLVSLDGYIDGFEPDISTYYQLAEGFNADMILIGSDTILKAVETEDIPREAASDFLKPMIDPNDKTPFWVIVDSRGRIRHLHFFRRTEYCKDLIVLVSRKTPEEHLNYLKERNYDFIIAGQYHIDYRKALELLSERYGAKVVRTDSGGILNGILLEQRLVDEINLVISPVLAGKGHTNLFHSLNLPEGNIKLKPQKCKTLEGGQVLLSYQVLK